MLVDISNCLDKTDTTVAFNSRYEKPTITISRSEVEDIAE